VAYLDTHPQNYRQQLHRSAWGWDGPTGLVTVHTAEGALDRIAPDTGAENVANYITIRSDPGGYHVLVDTDSTIVMARDEMRTGHTRAGNLNGPGWGISAAVRSTEWDPDAEWTKTIIASMGAEIRAFWERQGFDPVASARWISGRDVLNAGGRVVGLTHHGDVQSEDRSDAWATHPRRAELDQMLIDAIVGAAPAPPPPSPPKDWFDMATKEELRTVISDEMISFEGDPAVQINGYLFQILSDHEGRLTRRWIVDQTELKLRQQTGQVRRGPVENITPDTEARFYEIPQVQGIPQAPF